MADVIRYAVGADDSNVLLAKAEIGCEPFTPEQVAETVAALKEDPPAPFDLSVKTRVFSTCAKEDRMFSHAEEKFHFALHALTGAAPQRQRLENAFAHLSYLKAKELPELLRPKLTEIQEELEYVSGIAWHVSASAAIAKMSDEQVSQLARRVHDLHDALMNFSRPYPTSASDIK